MHAEPVGAFCADGAAEDERAAAGAVEPVAVRVAALAGPRGGDPDDLAAGLAMHLLQRELEAARDAPDVLPLLGDECVAAADDGCEGAEADDVVGEHLSGAVVIDIAHGGGEIAEPAADFSGGVGGRRATMVRAECGHRDRYTAVIESAWPPRA